MDLRAKCDIKEILQNLIEYPERINDAVTEIVDVSDGYRRRLAALRARRKQIEKDIESENERRS